MPRLKRAANKPPRIPIQNVASSLRQPEPEEGDEILHDVEEEEEMMENPEQVAQPGSRRKRTSAEVKADKQARWEKSFVKRGVKNERHVDVESIGPHHTCVQRIIAQGLAYFFSENPGYIKGLVADFYKNVKVPELGKIEAKGAKITSKIGRVTVVVDPEIIAKALNYERPPPESINCPREDFASRDEVNQALYVNPAEAKRPHVPGKFKDEYRLINQFVHHNLNPRGTENKPARSEGEMLYFFMEPGNVFDWAKYIFQQMVEFKANVPTQTRMPYPCMVTKICLEKGVPRDAYEEWGKLEPGIINSSILTRSASQVRGALGDEGVRGGSYLTTMPPKRAKQSVWQKLLFCQGVATINSHRKLKREIRENARRQQRIDHKLDYVLRRQEGTVSEPYVPQPDVEAEDSDDFAGEEPESGDED
ncbi:hypothetical protein RHSIM_Rhsim09G0079300 [Rhododendron simsii]|uniref:Putative plant transposon protein domain-containing protein n=1 Tax=Rhododendron simsii TaxID=118357 RepID=A0A834GGQ3_RHOSS|nr:hypothetical protein RHSIM_Rhsim09G0079300 [Rhododendron simsii]